MMTFRAYLLTDAVEIGFMTSGVRGVDLVSI